MRRAAPSGARLPRHWLLYQRAPQVDRPLTARGDGWFAVPSAPTAQVDDAARGCPGDHAHHSRLPSSASCYHVVGQSEIAQALRTQAPTLVVTDADSTLINEEVIDLLADAAGVGRQVADITEQAMQGDLDFSWSLGQRVALLKGLPQQTLTEVGQAVTLTPGAREFVEWAHAVGADFGVVSGGFTEVIEPLLARLGIRYALANRLEVHDGRLTGRTVGPVVTADLKAQTLREWAGGSPDRSVAVGDGANDIQMLHAAGMGFAFCAKPVVREQVANYVGIRRLDAVAGLLGWSVTQD